MPFDSTSTVRLSKRRRAVQSDTLGMVDQITELLATPEHWIKGEPWKGAAYCLVGAWSYMQIHRDAYLANVVYEAMRSEAIRRNTTVVGFNDHPDTTHADILDFLACVRRRLEAQNSR